MTTTVHKQNKQSIATAFPRYREMETEKGQKENVKGNLCTNTNPAKKEQWKR